MSKNNFKDCKTLLQVANEFEETFGAKVPSGREILSLPTPELIQIYAVYSNYKTANGQPKITFSNFKANIETFRKDLNLIVKPFEQIEAEVSGNKSKATKTDNSGKNIFTFINGALGKISSKLNDANVKAGEAYSDFANRQDRNISDIKEVLGDFIQVIGNVTGSTTLVDSLNRIVYNETKGVTTRRGVLRAGEKCREYIDDYINKIMAIDPDEEDLKTVAQLRFAIDGDEGDQKSGHRSVFTAAFNSIAWICKKVVRKLRDWGIYDTNAETNIFGTVGACIASIFGMVAGVIKSVLAIVFECIKFVSSTILGAVFTAISFVLDTLKGWAGKAFEKVTADDTEDEIFNDPGFEPFDTPCKEEVAVNDNHFKTVIMVGTYTDPDGDIYLVDEDGVIYC